jgi:probable HAF family extracellular repeat protein
MRQLLCAGICACWLSVVANEVHAAEFVVTDLGTLGSGNSDATGVNSRGQVIGNSSNAQSFNSFAYIWSPTVPGGTVGAMQEIGLPSFAAAINDRGQVAGGDGARAYLWTPTLPNGTTGAPLDIGTLGGTFSEGDAINSNGLVTGRSSFTPESLSYHAFLYDGSMHNLGTLGGTDSQGMGISNSGVVVGWSATGQTDVTHAFIYDGSMHDLGTLGGQLSLAYGVNNAGQVTGWAGAPGLVNHAFLYDGTMHDLDPSGMGSVGFGINGHGQITGSFFVSRTASHAFVYTSERGMVDLNTLIDPLSGWELNSGMAINDAGQIVGDGKIGGEFHGFLATPVLEPSAFLLAALGTLILGIWRGIQLTCRVRLKQLLICTIVLLNFGIVSHATAQTYVGRDLFVLTSPFANQPGSPFDLSSTAPSIAFGGQVVGSWTGGPNASPVSDALIWTSPNGTIVNLQSGSATGFRSSVAIGTDGVRQVGFSGSYGFLGDGAFQHAVLWNGAADLVVDLNPTNLPGIVNSSAIGISGSQQVGVGSGSSPSSKTHALVWNGTASSAVDLQPQIGEFDESVANGTDGARQVGYLSNFLAGKTHAVLWSGSAGSAVDLNPTNLAGFDYSIAYGVKSQWQVGEGGTLGGFLHALLWKGTADSAADLNPSNLSGITYSVAYITQTVKFKLVMAPRMMAANMHCSGVAPPIRRLT